MKLLVNKQGNQIIGSVVATAILGAIVVLVIQGISSMLAFKNRVEMKSSISSVESGILSVISKGDVYKLSAVSGGAPVDTGGVFVNRLLGGTGSGTPPGLEVPQAGKLVVFDPETASQLLGASAQDAYGRCNNTQNAPIVPTTGNSFAVYVFCLSGSNSSSLGQNAFFGSEVSFGIFKVSLKSVNASHSSFITSSATFQEFVGSPTPNTSFQAEIYYSIYWGKKKDEKNSFEKSGYAIKDLY